VAEITYQRNAVGSNNFCDLFIRAGVSEVDARPFNASLDFVAGVYCMLSSRLSNLLSHFSVPQISPKEKTSRNFSISCQ